MTVQWRKSTYSGGATDETCVEVAGLPGAIGIRDSKDPDGDRLTVTGAAFGDLLKKIKNDDLDRT